VDSARILGLFAAHQAGALLAIDYDGTLAPIVADPASARPAPGAVELLVKLSAGLGHIAVITGRPAADAVRLGRLDRIPDLTVLGLYGRDRWSGGVVHAGAAPDGLSGALAAIRQLVQPDERGIVVEDKGAAVAVHTRRAGDPKGEFDRLERPLAEIADAFGLRLEPGRLVLELRDPTVDKGSALLELVADWRPSSLLYLGDDLGDLPAFAATTRLRAQGVAAWSIAVESDEAPEVAAAADATVAGVAGAVHLLAELLEAIEQR